MMKAIVLVALAASEHWFCGLPSLLHHGHVDIYDFEVAGNELVEKPQPPDTSPIDPYQILRNDAAALVAVGLAPDAVADVIVIDKISGAFTTARVYAAAGSRPFSGQGTCRKGP
jgi:hypothetical protein